MKKILILFFIFFNIICPHNQSKNMSFSVSTPNKQNQKIKSLAIIQSKKQNPNLIKLVKTIKYDLEFSDQLEVDLKIVKNKLNRKTELDLFKNGISLCINVQKSGNNQIKLELKDLSSNFNILKKNFDFDSKNIEYSGHKISSKLLPLLTGNKGICLNALAYSKMLSPNNKIICIADYAGKKEKAIINTKSINIAPSWHTKADIIYFSQFLTNKISLKSINLKTKKSSIICSYDGLNMQPSFSPDGSKAAICLSGGKNSNIYLYDQRICTKLQKRVFIPLTNNRGNNVSPCLLPNNDLIFCSDFERGNPQIYYLDKQNNKTYRLTNGRGYCAAPSYCPKTNTIVYTRFVRGIFQLFSLNINNRQEKQITFNSGNKHEPDISECGRFVVFSWDHQIAALNLASGKIRKLTTGNEPKNFPKWSKRPVVF